MYRYIYSVCTLKSRDYIDGEATSATHKQLSDGTGRSSAAGKSDEGCDGNTFFFLPLLLVRGSAFGYTGWKSYEFQGKCCAANAAKKEKERETERECAQRDLPWVDWASCNWLWAADQVNCTTTTAAMTLTATTAKAKRARTLSREGKLERSKSSLFTPTMGIFCVSADCRWGLAMNESSDRRKKNKQT